MNNMNTSYEFLTEKETMWAGMLTQVLRDNQIPCVSEPVYGAGFAIKAGLRERQQIFVPAEKKPLAEDLLKGLGELE